jgi:kynurenine formamidase
LTRNLILLATVAALSISVKTTAAQGLLPSPYGPEDQAGASNLITPEKALQAAGLITQGRIYPLSRIYETEMPMFGRRVFALRGTGGIAGGPLGQNQAIWNDEFIATEIGQIGTQFDGLGHVGIRTSEGDLYYNNIRGEDLHGPGGLLKLGVEHVKPFFTRGVLVDIERYKGEMMDAGYEVTLDDILGALEQQGIDPDSISSGDVVLFHTGWGALWKVDNVRFASGEPGIGMEAAVWLGEKGVSMVGADTWGMEAVPNPDGVSAFPVHQEFLVRRGIFIMENVATEDLAADGVYEFAFSFAPMKIKGATGVPGNAMAIR